MIQEQLRMQMLAGIITEGQYKVKLNEETLVDSFQDYYIANKDTEIRWANGNERPKKILIPAKTVIRAVGGGLYKSIDGKIVTGINPLKGNPDFKVVNNMTGPNTINLTDDIESWSRNTNKLIQNDPDNIEQIIADRAKIIDAIREMIK
jgi:hypothetical protein